jgi:hypothetical protein
MVSRKMKKLYLPVLCCMALALVFFQVPAKCYAFDIEIDVSPNVLNIQSKSIVVTVHTDVAYSTVVGSSVFLNGVLINSWKADDRGNFVAKFVSDEIKTLGGLVIGGYNTLTLTGYDTVGDAFIGTQEIMVIDIEPVGTGKE